MLFRSSKSCPAVIAKAQPVQNPSASVNGSEVMLYPNSIVREVPAVKQSVFEANLEAVIFPNPTASHFKLNVISPVKSEKIQVLILDAQGREYGRNWMISGQTETLGDDLRSGVYFIQVSQGQRSKTIRLIKI